MPELRRSGAHWVVSVPSGAEIEALSLWRESGARGFFFNGFDDAGSQASLNRILKLSDPTRVVVANFPGLEYQAIHDYESIRELILGYGCPWPDLACLKRLTCFSAMEIGGDLRQLPAGLLELGLYGFRAATLEPLSFLHHLQRLDLRMAGRLENLSGIGCCLSDLSLAACPRLRDITALKGHARIERLALSSAKGLVNVDEVFTLPNLRELILDKIKATPDVERLESMELDHCYINGRKLAGRSRTSGTA